VEALRRISINKKKTGQRDNCSYQTISLYSSPENAQEGSEKEERKAETGGSDSLKQTGPTNQKVHPGQRKIPRPRN